MSGSSRPTTLLVGSFDMLHVGHVRLLSEGGVGAVRIVVGLLSDELCERLLGFVPFIPESDRYELVSAISGVDGAVIVRTTCLVELVHECSCAEVLLDADLPPDGFDAGPVAVRVLPELDRPASELLRAALDARQRAAA